MKKTAKKKPAVKKATAKLRAAKPALIDYNAESIREAMEKIADSNNGFLAPQAIVQAARNPKNPLHDSFTWDDGEAAERYRLVEAQHLIRTIKIHIVRRDEPSRKMTVTSTRAFESRGSQRNAAGGYEPIQELMSSKAKRAEILMQALRELEAMRRRYDSLTELHDIWLAIDEAIAQPAPKKKVRK